MKSDHARRGIGMVVVAAVVSLPGGMAPRADEFATLQGRVVSADGATPRDGVVIALHDGTGERLFASTPSNESGAFRIDTARPGSYTLVVEAEEGAFIAGESVTLTAGSNSPLALALKPVPDGEDDGTEDPGTIPPAADANTGLSTAAKWGIAGVVIIGIAGVYAILNDDEQKASNF